MLLKHRPVSWPAPFHPSLSRLLRVRAGHSDERTENPRAGVGADNKTRLREIILGPRDPDLTGERERQKKEKEERTRSALCSTPPDSTRTLRWNNFDFVRVDFFFLKGEGNLHEDRYRVNEHSHSKLLKRRCVPRRAAEFQVSKHPASFTSKLVRRLGIKLVSILLSAGNTWHGTALKPRRIILRESIELERSRDRWD